MDAPSPRRIGTVAVHGAGPAKTDGPLTTPILQTSTFVLPDTQAVDDVYDGRRVGHIYTRYGNPTLDAAAARVAALEGAEAALITASGMSAIAVTALAFARAGGRVVTVADLYGGTAGLFHGLLARFGVRVDAFPTTDAKALEEALREPADLVYLESPTNPTLKLADLRACAAAARRAGVPSAVDSTFATPVNSRPVELGVDLVIHSATKYLGGHADLTLGVVAGRRDLVERAHEVAKSLGPTPDPFAAFLLERGLKTLHLRVRQANANAQALAEALARHPKVARVHYPGLPSHPQHGLARAQMPGGCGGLLAFDLAAGTKAAAARFVDALCVARNAASLGSVESLVSLPVVQSHRHATPEVLARAGITPATVRFGCGIEETEDLLADVAQALEKV